MKLFENIYNQSLQENYKKTCSNCNKKFISKIDIFGHTLCPTCEKSAAKCKVCGENMHGMKGWPEERKLGKCSNCWTKQDLITIGWEQDEKTKRDALKNAENTFIKLEIDDGDFIINPMSFPGGDEWTEVDDGEFIYEGTVAQFIDDITSYYDYSRNSDREVQIFTISKSKIAGYCVATPIGKIFSFHNRYDETIACKVIERR